MREVIFYKLKSGKCPVEGFLDSLSSKQAQKVAWVLQLIEELDVVPTSYLKNLVNTPGILEVRIRVGRNIFRILGFRHKRTFVVLTNGFQKKDQKTPKHEIELAEERKKDYLNRKDKK